MEKTGKTGYTLGGEMLITDDGVYTFAYTYRAPWSDAQVLLIGMNHWGDEAYFRRVGEILSVADIIVYEGVRPESRDEYQKIWGKIDELNKNHLSPEQAEFYSLVEKFQTKALKAAKLTTEQDVLPIGGENWISGDEKFWLELIQNERALARYAGDLLAAAKRVPPEILGSLTAFLKVKNRLLSEKNLRRAMGEYWLLTCDTADFYTSLTREYERETMALEIMEGELVAKKPARIALKFGCAHTERLRRALESFDYKLLKSERLLNISFFK